MRTGSSDYRDLSALLRFTLAPQQMEDAFVNSDGRAPGSFLVHRSWIPEISLAQRGGLPPEFGEVGINANGRAGPRKACRKSDERHFVLKRGQNQRFHRRPVVQIGVGQTDQE